MAGRTLSQYNAIGRIDPASFDAALSSSSSFQSLESYVQATYTEVQNNNPSAIASAVSSELTPTLQFYQANHSGVDLEILSAVVGATNHVEVWGFIVTGNASSTEVSLRSGNTANDGSSSPVRTLPNTADATMLRPISDIGPGMNTPPGTRPLWRTDDGEGLIVKKEDSGAGCYFQVWFRTVPNV